MAANPCTLNTAVNMTWPIDEKRLKNKNDLKKNNDKELKKKDRRN